MGKSTFIQTVEVEPTEVQKDEAIIEDYFNNKDKYLDESIIKKLKDFINWNKQSFRGTAYTYDSDVKDVIDKARESREKSIFDNEYDDLVNTLIQAYDTIRTNRMLLQGNKKEKFVFSNYLEAFYNSMHLLVKFHEERDERYEQARVRVEYKNTIVRLKESINRLPTELSSNTNLGNIGTRTLIESQIKDLKDTIKELNRIGSNIKYNSR